jgi:hypothetical protein
MQGITQIICQTFMLFITAPNVAAHHAAAG